MKSEGRVTRFIDSVSTWVGTLIKRDAATYHTPFEVTVPIDNCNLISNNTFSADIRNEINFDKIILNEIAFVENNITQSVYMCRNTTKLLIAVISHVDDVEGRMLIRNTWGKQDSDKTEIRFIVGKRVIFWISF